MTTTSEVSRVGSMAVVGWVGVLARLILGLTYLTAGVDKAQSLAVTQQATRAFRILPYDLANAWGVFMPFLEIILGVLLVVGLLTRWTAIAGGVLMAVFIAGIISVWVRGISIDCGCFGGGGSTGATQYPLDIARDVGLLACAVWLVVFPLTKLSADRVLWGR